MPYSELKSRLSRLVHAAAPDALRRFALDTIALLRQRAEEAIVSELSQSERASFLVILESIDKGPPEELVSSFETFHGGICADEERAIEFHHDLVELFCAVDAFIRYRLRPDAKQILRIAISGVNSVDYLIAMDDGADDNYSTDNMFGDERMLAEYRRQERLLTLGQGG